MTKSWDGFSKEPLSDEELQKIRRQIKYHDENDKVLKRFIMALKMWWLLPLGAGLAITGAAGEFLKVLASNAGFE